mmetsp:Transcript_67631/g.220163  ORF Transcript_67631/g.220163 Transcript_67631/m.220163 type:complete len:226 (-) Transcript_67631:1019-1696(-)
MREGLASATQAPAIIVGWCRCSQADHPFYCRRRWGIRDWRGGNTTPACPRTTRFSNSRSQRRNRRSARVRPRHRHRPTKGARTCSPGSRTGSTKPAEPPSTCVPNRRSLLRNRSACERPGRPPALPQPRQPPRPGQKCCHGWHWLPNPRPRSRPRRSRNTTAAGPSSRCESSPELQALLGLHHRSLRPPPPPPAQQPREAARPAARRGPGSRLGSRRRHRAKPRP